MKLQYKDIKKFLSQCAFNPKKKGPLSVIADVGNIEYYEIRAIEFIKDARNLTLTDYNDNIVKAIQLLALARITKEQQLNELKDSIEEEYS